MKKDWYKARNLFLGFCFLIIILICLAACTAEYVLNTSVIPSDGGKITALSVKYEGTEVLIPSGPGAGTYKDGSEVTLTTEAASGFRFDHWSGDVSGTDNPITITMDSDRSVVANFREATVSGNIGLLVIKLEDADISLLPEGTIVTVSGNSTNATGVVIATAEIQN